MVSKESVLLYKKIVMESFCKESRVSDHLKLKVINHIKIRSFKNIANE
jgi:hypothetical protein